MYAMVCHSGALVMGPPKCPNKIKIFPTWCRYNMYAMVCHSGALGGGHYVSYSKTEGGSWFCHNDSACKEVPEASIDKSTAYILLYEREGLSLSGTRL